MINFWIYKSYNYSDISDAIPVFIEVPELSSLTRLIIWRLMSTTSHILKYHRVTNANIRHWIIKTKIRKPLKISLFIGLEQNKQIIYIDAYLNAFKNIPDIKSYNQIKNESPKVKYEINPNIIVMRLDYHTPFWKYKILGHKNISKEDIERLKLYS